MAKLTTAQKAEQRIAELKQQGIDMMLKLDVVKTLSKLNLFNTARYLHKKNLKSKNAEKLIKALHSMEKAEEKLFNLIQEVFIEQVGAITENNFEKALLLLEECSNAPIHPFQVSASFAVKEDKPKRTRKPRIKKPTEGYIELPHAIPTEGYIELPHAIPTEGSISTNE